MRRWTGIRVRLVCPVLAPDDLGNQIRHAELNVQLYDVGERVELRIPIK